MPPQVAGQIVDQLVDFGRFGHRAIEVEIWPHQHGVDAVLRHERNELVVQIDQRVRASHRPLGGHHDVLGTQGIEKGLEDLEDFYLAAATMERVRKGDEKVYTSAQVKADLGLDD